MKTVAGWICVILVAMWVIGPGLGIAAERTVDLVIQRPFHGMQQLNLREELRRQAPNFNPKGHGLAGVEVTIKAGPNGGTAALQVGPHPSDRVPIGGGPPPRRPPRPNRAVRKAFISNPFPFNKGPWLLILDGHLFLETVRLHLITHRPGPEIPMSEFCVRHSQRSPVSGVRDTGWICAAPGQESGWIFTGDDTGYLDQRIKIRVSGPHRVCLRFSHRSPQTGVHDSGWVCSSHGRESGWIFLGDDTGYFDQKLMIRAEGPEAYCIRQRRHSPNSGKIDTGWACSRDGRPSQWIPLGDDSGFRDQQLKIRH
jgi:hypothetical protein